MPSCLPITIIVREHRSIKSSDRTQLTGADGKLVKDKLLKVFVMGKNTGWGQAAPEGQRNGDWIYSAFLADAKTPSGEPIAPCRTCHLPLTSKDFVHRYDEYFSARVRFEPPVKRPAYGY